MNYTQLVNEIQNYTENQFTTDVINTFIDQAELRIYNTVQFPSLRKNVTGITIGGNKYLSTPDDFLSVYSIAVIDDDGNYEYLLNKDVNFIRSSFPNPNTQGIPKYYAIFGPTTTNAIPPVITNELSFILGPTPDKSYNTEMHYYYYPESIVQGVITSCLITNPGSGLTNGVYYNVPLISSGSGRGSLATANIVVSGNVVSSISIVNGGVYYVPGDTINASVSNIGGVGTTFTATASAVSNPNGTSWLGDNFDAALFYGSLLEAYTYMKGEPDVYAAYQKRYDEAMIMAKRLGDGLERGDAYRSGQYRIPPFPQNSGVV